MTKPQCPINSLNPNDQLFGILGIGISLVMGNWEFKTFLPKRILDV